MNTIFKNWTFVCICLVFVLCGCEGSKKKEVQPEKTYINPIMNVGAEPWAMFHEGYYYYMQGMENKLVLWKTKDITDLRHAPRKTIFVPTDPKISQHMWGPEIHFINGKWYVYFVADDGNMDNHQIYVLENASADPFQGHFYFKGRISTDKGNNWAIHPNIFIHKGSLYMTWSGWQSRRVNVEESCIYIAKMNNPWTLSSDRILLSKPEMEWERQWINPDGTKTAYTIYVNEAPQFFRNKTHDKVYIYYSASGNWTPFYALGRLTADANSNLLDPKSWTKSPRPLFKQSPKNNIYATGNCCFLPSPDGLDYYLLYHARTVENEVLGAIDSRAPRLQKINWTDDGTPILGEPVQDSIPMTKPSGL